MKSCKSCRYYAHKPDGGYCGNEDSPCYRISILPYYAKGFYCSLWIKGIDNDVI